MCHVRCRQMYKLCNIQRIGIFLYIVRRSSQNSSIFFVYISLFLIFLSSCFPTESYGQEAPVSHYRKIKEINEDSIVPFKDRWAFKTNAVDWLCILPNLTAEFDLGNSPYNRHTLSLGAKWNWNTSQNYKPSTVLLSAMIDVRIL